MIYNENNTIKPNTEDHLTSSSTNAPDKVIYYKKSKRLIMIKMNCVNDEIKKDYSKRLNISTTTMMLLNCIIDRYYLNNSCTGCISRQDFYQFCNAEDTNTNLTTKAPIIPGSFYQSIKKSIDEISKLYATKNNYLLLSKIESEGKNISYSLSKSFMDSIKKDNETLTIPLLPLKYLHSVYQIRLYEILYIQTLKEATTYEITISKLVFCIGYLLLDQTKLVSSKSSEIDYNCLHIKDYRFGTFKIFLENAINQINYALQESDINIQFTYTLLKNLDEKVQPKDRIKTHKKYLLKEDYEEYSYQYAKIIFEKTNITP